ncbi:putative pseudouridine synthase TruD/Pus7 [Microthyrium microscopicum]|uniref:Putative pseudouridine synthase TruD/Pus7 n=1 Tax=Microthyrium microscopicum TaxID=703497 RepID=A0A6A6TZX9_9PEZI|nr:putative pseudouridine synthase TruD/Pus7 [Microthyrium microscopicum]
MSTDTTADHPRKRIRLDNDAAASESNAIQPPPVPGWEDDYEKEVRAGITAFVSPGTPGLAGVFKQRYSDFLVNEIVSSGDVLHLTDIADQTSLSTVRESSKAGAEAGSKTEQPVKPKATVEKSEKPPPVEMSEEDLAQLQEIFGESTTAAIVKLHKTVHQHPDKKRKDFEKITSEEIEDKADRTKAHQTIRRVFQSRLDSSTNENNALIISASLSAASRQSKADWQQKREAGGNQSKGRLGWEELGGEYLHFTLYKENKDTMEVLNYIGRMFKLAPKHFQFSGTKDRRAVAVQRISAYRVQAERLAALNKSLKGAKIGGFKYETYPLALGQLQGNEFNITLRDCHFPGEDGLDEQARFDLAKGIVTKAVENIKKDGFINYFGLQRFGTLSISTDEVGVKMLQGDLKAAVQLILGYSPIALAAGKNGGLTTTIPIDDRKRALALEEWETSGNSKKALNMMPRKYSGEIAIITFLGQRRNGVKTNEQDWKGALSSISRNLRLMYIHAYQSMVWNTVAARRWERFGTNVVEGDLVVVDTAAKNSLVDVDESGELIIQPEGEDRAAGDADFIRARPLTKEEAESGKHSIWDIVLPQPGFDVNYPANEIGEFYKEFMGSEKGGGLDPHNMRRTWREISLSGGYRNFLSRPNLMEGDVRSYTNDTEQLVKTDVDLLLEKSGEAQANPSSEVTMAGDSDALLAVVLKMQLGSSQYATMALREMLKAGGLKSYKAEFKEFKDFRGPTA